MSLTKQGLMKALRDMPAADVVYISPGDMTPDGDGDIEACHVEYLECYNSAGMRTGKHVRIKAGC